MRLLIATGNANKVREFNALFSDFGTDIFLESLKDINFTDEIEENGATFEENSYIKAAALAARGYTAIADDSGLCVDALGGAPGIYSARYAHTGNDDDNINLLLENLKDVPPEKRTARFVCVITCIFPKHRHSIVARGECEGIIIDEKRGSGGFGYDPVFFIPSLGKTFSELSGEEKNAISHRGRAMADFKRQFSEYIEECKRVGRHI